MLSTRSYLGMLGFFVTVLSACGGGGGGGGGGASATFNLQCDLSASYTPSAPPIVSVGTGAPTTTVIALHGNSGSPDNSVMQTLTTDLNPLGYTVKKPYLPWTSLVWDGTLCDGITYVNSLVAAEKASGNSVILLGHSLGGVFVTTYAAHANITNPDGYVMLASGHFVPNSNNLNSQHAASIQSAKNKISAGQGDVLATFQTSDYSITATPNVYLSFHGIDQLPDQFSDLKAAIPLISVPSLWFAGLSDPLLGTTKNLGVFDSFSANSVFTYEEIVGDHFSLADNVVVVLDPWYQGL